MEPNILDEFYSENAIHAENNSIFIVGVAEAFIGLLYLSWSTKFVFVLTTIHWLVKIKL